MRLAALAFVVACAPGLALAWAGSGLGPYVPPPPHDYPRSELRASAVLADGFAPWCAFMHFGPAGPEEARLRIEPGAAIPDGITIAVSGDPDPATLARFLECLAPHVAALPGTYVGTRPLTRTYALHHDTPRARVVSAAEAIARDHDAEIRACAPSGAAIAAIRLDVYRGEVRLDAVHLPTLDPRYAMAGTGDASVHDCVSAVLAGTTIDARGRVFPIVELD
jgi:hypothetical protein